MSSDPDLKTRLLQLVRDLADELRPASQFAQGLGIEHSLERDYGLDSLSRAELVTRIEAELGVTLDVAALARAETPGDLLRTIRTAAPAPALAASVRDADPDSDDPRVDYPPDSLDTLPDVLDWHAEHHGERLATGIARSARTTPATPGVRPSWPSCCRYRTATWSSRCRTPSTAWRSSMRAGCTAR